LPSGGTSEQQYVMEEDAVGAVQQDCGENDEESFLQSLGASGRQKRLSRQLGQFFELINSHFC
jgi:hypothetical protein